MIADELQELAALYALGMLRGEEAAAFEKQCAENAELAALVQSFRDTADGMAFALPPVAPPAALRDRVLGQEWQAPAANVIRFPNRRRASGWQVTALVASVAAVVLGTVLFFTSVDANLQRSGREKIARQVEWLQTDNKSLYEANDSLTKERDITKRDLDNTQRQLADATAMSTKLQADFNMLQSDKDKLLAEVTALKARGLYHQARIALMASTTKPATKATAVSLWDQDAQGGVIVVQNLPALPANRNYQLWVLDDGQPVSAGLLTLDGKGGGRIEFKARKPIAKPTLFAVTNEAKGEKDAPDLEKLVLAGQ